MAATVIVACVVFNKISSRLGLPMLLAFILLGMFFGSDGVVKISFDDYSFTEEICSVALVFIMFYGGFGTNWNEARPAAAKAILMSSLGTVLTAGLVGVFCFFALKIPLYESFLIGSVICSTDAASVFSILRSKHLNLKYNTASLLEVESGSNDPASYMLTVIFLSLMKAQGGEDFGYMIFAQVAFGIAFGVATAVLATLFLQKVKLSGEGFDTTFIVAVALTAYAAPALLGGNGYLSVYITGIILGNSRIPNKNALVNFFDGVTGLMQMLLFFLLGLLATPSLLPGVAPRALLIALFLTFAARPIAVALILTPFGCRLNQQLLVSWAGMRGAASIVFAIMTVISPVKTENDIFHLVFFIVLFSILLQGSLIPLAAKVLKMTDDASDVMKTFNDYTDEVPVQFIRFTMTANHPWVGKTIAETVLPPESIFVLIIRNGKRIVPNGKTVLYVGDSVVMSGRAGSGIEGVRLYEKKITPDSDFIGKPLFEFVEDGKLVIMIRRGSSVIIPKGNTLLAPDDVLVINEAG